MDWILWYFVYDAESNGKRQYKQTIKPGGRGGGEWCVYACVVAKMSATDRIVLMDLPHTSLRHLW